MKLVRDLDKLWILKKKVYSCYDVDQVGNRTLISDYGENSTIGQKESESSSFEKAKKSLNGHSYKGVSLHKRSYQQGAEKCWHSRLFIPAKNGQKSKSLHIGSFKSSTEAAIAWNDAVKEAGLESIKGLNKIKPRA